MRRPWLRFQMLCLLLSQLTSIFALAQTTLDVNSATSAATGGAGRAAVDPMDVHTLNPAILVHLRDRDFHIAAGNRSWLVGITDNSLDTMISGALSYSEVKTGDSANELSHRNLRLSLAGFVTTNFSMGVTIHQRSTKADVASWSQNNADLGFSYLLTPRVGLALVMSDLMSSSLEKNNPIRLQPRTALGIHTLVSEFIGLRADWVSGADHDFNKAMLALGYEGILNEFARFRLGWGHEKGTGLEYATGGFGLDLPRFRLDYAYQGAIRSGFENRHSIDLGIPF